MTLIRTLGLLLIAGSGTAQAITCAEVKYGTPSYHDNMDELARAARLPDSYWHKYHEELVADLCEGKSADARRLVDSGLVKASEAAAIKKNLVVAAAPRSESGNTYGFTRKKFSEMGLCNACADNVAQWYTKRPESACGKLAKSALEGNPQAESTLVSFPAYCEWKY